MRQARREIKRLRMERDILKKAAAWFAGRATRSRKGFKFVKAYRARFPIRVMCRVLGLSPSGYYAWLKRPPSKRARRDRTLRETIVWIWNQNRRVYGSASSACRAESSRGTDEPEARRSIDEGSRDPGGEPEASQGRAHPEGPEGAPGTGPGEPELRG